MAKKQAISRRRFLDVAGKLACGGAVVVAVPTFIPASALGRNGRPAPSERVTMACLGLGFGWPMFLRDDVQVLAVCDVRQDRREFGKQQVDAYPKSLLQVNLGPHERVQLPGDFVQCVRNGLETCAPVEVAHHATNLCSIGAISMSVGRQLTWDATREEFVGDEAANRLRSRAMREPWSL